MKILIVDDERRSLATMKKVLARRGYDADTADNGLEALDKLNDFDTHVVILDVKMPDMDGMETLRAIKRKFPIVEVIMLTGHGTNESALEGLKAGASAYLIKPADIDELIKKVEEAFDRRSRIEEKIRNAGIRKSDRPK